MSHVTRHTSHVTRHTSHVTPRADRAAARPDEVVSTPVRRGDEGVLHRRQTLTPLAHANGTLEGGGHLFCDHELGVVDAGVWSAAAGVSGHVEEADGQAAEGCGVEFATK